MTSFAYDSVLEDQARAKLNFASDSFKVMLVGEGYRPNKRGHSRRSDVTDEVAGEGYDAGGVLALVSLARDAGNDRLEITLGSAQWPKATVKAKGAVYYKSRGGVPSADELVAYIGFDSPVSSFMGKFALSESILRFQNKAEVTV